MINKSGFRALVLGAGLLLLPIGVFARDGHGGGGGASTLQQFGERLSGDLSERAAFNQRLKNSRGRHASGLLQATKHLVN